MTFWRRWIRHRALDSQLDAELRDHIEREVADAVRAGEHEADARRRIRLHSGGPDQVKEACRDVRHPRLLVNIWTDVRFATRILVRDRWFTTGAVVALALAIGLANAVFISVNATHLRGMPFDHPSRIATLHTFDGRGFIRPLSYLDFEDWRQQSTRVFDAVGAYTQTPITLTDDGGLPQQVDGLVVSASTFRVLGVKPVIGREFSADDDRPGAEAVATISANLWRGRYAATPGIVGRRLVLNGTTPATVVGVMPDGFGFDKWVDVWVPMSQLPGPARQRREQRNLWGVARLRDGVTFDQARVDLTTVGEKLAGAYPDTNKDVRPWAVPIGEAFVGAPLNSSIVLMPMLAALAILLVACANLASLLLARAASRFREVSIRVAIGATRWQIVRQLLIESLTISSVAAATGLVLSLVIVRQTIGRYESQLGWWIQLDIDYRVLAFLLLTAVATSVLFGLAPALYATRHAVNGGLKEGGRAGESIKARRWTLALMIAEFGLTLALVNAAGLTARSYAAVYALDANVRTDDILTASIRLPAPKYATPAQRFAFHDQLRERLSGAGIAMSTVASPPPFSATGRRRLPLLDGRPVGDEVPTVAVINAGPESFDTLRLPLTLGRTFSADDGTPGREAVIVNRRFVGTYLGDQSPIGRTLTLETTGANASRTTASIVGVAPDVRQGDSEMEPIVYLPFRATAPAATTLIVRRTGDAAQVLLTVRQAMQAIDPTLALGGVRTLDDLRDSSRVGWLDGASSMARFALVALLLAGVGLYSVVAYSVARRTQEVGLRMALGAQPRQVRWLFLKTGVSVVIGGLAVGLPASLFVGRLLDINLVGVSAHDPATLVVTAAVIAVVALAACVIPARRATRLNPTVALRME